MSRTIYNPYNHDSAYYHGAPPSEDEYTSFILYLHGKSKFMED